MEKHTLLSQKKKNFIFESDYHWIFFQECAYERQSHVAVKSRFLDYLCSCENSIFANYQKQQQGLRISSLVFNYSPLPRKRTEPSPGVINSHLTSDLCGTDNFTS